MIMVGVSVVPVYFSGEPAEGKIEHLPGVTEKNIHNHEEAAEFLGIATGTSKAQLHRGRRLLAVQLGLA